MGSDVVSVQWNAIVGDGWRVAYPDGSTVLERTDGPRRVERFVEIRSEDLGLAGRVVLELPPGGDLSADSSFAVAAEDFSSRDGFAWLGRASIQGKFEKPAQYGQFRFSATEGVLLTALVDDARTVSVVWLYPDALTDSLAPIVLASLKSLVGSDRAA